MSGSYTYRTTLKIQFIRKMIVLKKWTAGTHRDSDLFHITYWERSNQSDFENYSHSFSGTYKRELSLAFEAFIQNSERMDSLEMTKPDVHSESVLMRPCSLSL